MFSRSGRNKFAILLFVEELIENFPLLLLLQNSLGGESRLFGNVTV